MTAEALISNLLRDLVEQIEAVGAAELSAGFLGGDYGYGAEVDNDVFEMFPYYSGDCECGHNDAESSWIDAHPHAGDCYQTELQRRQEADEAANGLLSDNWSTIASDLASERGLPELGCGMHCTCGRDDLYAAWASENTHSPTCGVVRPNFLHKPTGVRVDWYKYIGRGMEITAPEAFTTKDWLTLYLDCAESLNAAA
ncbi:hypothetical protein [Leifsonia sp. Leaf264]|uniref:hypothetical protein n=1 Tax=Leifsonia sp. Leaf264 TaxID=1736314 RepID=UPI0006FD36D6|nr:hypothetical protein [Leifsonia sp. Leaf264]KQO98896.1 hypothetical protein ASF30_12605 [Leifsonia sp. Leaf264]